MQQNDYLVLLDQVLAYAQRNTGADGLVCCAGESDRKDQGWLILAGTIRGITNGFSLDGVNLAESVKKWSLAVADTDDDHSVWSTFALLYSLYLVNGWGHFPFHNFNAQEKKLVEKFFRQINMATVRAASANYRVAAALINILRFTLGYGSPGRECIQPSEDIKSMLNRHLGEGFFNDDDGRGEETDKRIDGYSAEIIGLLMHYEEISGADFELKQEIGNVVESFLANALYFVDAHGEYAKQGRSLRGESDIKKAFLFEYAAAKNLFGSGKRYKRAASLLSNFFQKTGFNQEEGFVYNDKGGNQGAWDEYTTGIQSLGYGAYGLAQALRYCRDDLEEEPIPSQMNSYLKYFPGSGMVVGNNIASGRHWVLPLRNKITKKMFLWWNRITGEENVEVDILQKFLPIFYFGREIDQPYCGEEFPFLPQVRAGGEVLYPRYVPDNSFQIISQTESAISLRQQIYYCRSESFKQLNIVLETEIALSPSHFIIKGEIKSETLEIQKIHFSFYTGCRANIIPTPEGWHTSGERAEVAVTFFRQPGRMNLEFSEGLSSIYRPHTEPVRVSFDSLTTPLYAYSYSF